MNILEITQHPKILKTEKGSVIKRNSKLGVGKDIGGFIYLHKMYKDLLPNIQEFEKILHNRHPSFNYNIIKYATNKPVVTFLYSPDFDTVEEPLVTDYVVVALDGRSKQARTNTIYHHKWTMVKDDYPGFDVEKSFQRSKAWLNIPNINFTRIGSSKEYWDNFLNLNKKHLPKDFDMPTDDKKYCYYSGTPLETGKTSTNFPVAPAIVWLKSANIIKDNSVVLDYGAGTYGRNSNYLRDNNVKTYAYDPFNGAKTDGWSGVSTMLVHQQFDVVFTSFVLNVVPKYVEEDIIKQTESLGKSVIHIVRNTDIKVMVKAALKKQDKIVMEFFKNYIEECNLEIDEITDSVIDDFCRYGVQTSKGFQRVCYLEEYGYEMIKGSYSSSYKVYAKL